MYDPSGDFYDYAEEAYSYSSATENPVKATSHTTSLQQLESILQDEHEYLELISQQGDLAQSILDLLQSLSHAQETSPRLRSSILKAVLRLSRQSNLYPQCMTIRNVKQLGEHPVASGGFGEIWMGGIEGSQELVCLKVVKLYQMSDTEKVLGEFLREAIVWRQLEHPNLLPFLGLYFLDEKQKKLCLISPWMENGNLNQFLKQTPRRNVNHYQLVWDVASGLQHLHYMKIIHADLKGANILVTKSGRAAIGDFGLSYVAEGEVLRMTSTSAFSGGTCRWLAPEIVTRSQPRPTYKSDIYSFGCVCYEIYTGLHPFHDLRYDANVILEIMKGNRPSRPTNRPELDDDMWSLIQRCWDGNTAIRPDIYKVRQWLDVQFGTAKAAPTWDLTVYKHIWQNVHGVGMSSRTDPDVAAFLAWSHTRLQARKSSMIGAEESPDVEEHEDVYTSSVQGLPSTLPAATPWPSITGGVRPSTSVHRRSNKLNQRPTVVKGLGGMLGSEKLEDRGRPVIPVVSGLGAVPVAVDTVRPPMRDVIRSGEKDREMDKLVGDGNNTTIAQKFGDESLTHQYYRELYLSRTEDNPECRLSHAEKLQLLRQREQSWINCQPDFTKLVPINFNPGHLYDLSAGVYILGDATRHRLKYLMLPSRPQDSMEWLTFEPKVTYWKDQGYIIDFAINLYEHDLIALITAVQDAEIFMIGLSIHEFSTGRFHPLAKQTIIPITRSEIQWGTPSINCEIVGEHLALVTTFWRNPLSRCTVYVYQWRTGKQLLHIDGEPDTYRGIIFLSEHFILLPNKANNTLEIWRIPPSSEGPPTFPVRVLSLPVLNPGYLLRNIVCRSEPNPTASGATLKSDKPFHPSPKESIVLLRLHIHGQTGIALITVFVHRSSLLSLVEMDDDEHEQRLAAGERGMRVPVPWPVWAPPVAYCMGNLPLRWITTTCGQRFVMLSPDDVELDVFGNREPAPLVVYDFGKGSVKKVESEYERLSLEDKLRYNGPVVRRAMSLPEESAKIFADPIESYLPFVETRTEQTYGFDGALMDDERIIGIKASLFGDVTSVEVLHFG